MFRRKQATQAAVTHCQGSGFLWKSILSEMRQKRIWRNSHSHPKRFLFSIQPLFVRFPYIRQSFFKAGPVSASAMPVPNTGILKINRLDDEQAAKSVGKFFEAGEKM
jgi:hypothetical protein